ncbi:MAG: trehalose-phosphatase, partial [Pseudomonadota bacterium]|nr:trehalose-phosphatase [Pseudomonadota bacterium]
MLEAPPPDLLDGAALFLDFDGTLVELAESPDSIRVASDLESRLERMRRRLGGRLALISGRSLADLERHVRLAGIASCGSHGLEMRLADGSSLPLCIPPGLDEIRQRVSAFAAGADGMLVEDKPAG